MYIDILTMLFMSEGVKKHKIQELSKRKLVGKNRGSPSQDRIKTRQPL